MTTEIDDPMLMAYADGELFGDERAAVERALAADPALAERVALFRRTRAAAAAALAERPVPPALAERVAAMVDAQERRRAAPEPAPRRSPRRTGRRRREARRPDEGALLAERERATRALPVAASIALLVGAVSGFVAAEISRPATVPAPFAAAGPAAPALAEALFTVPSGTAGDLPGGARLAPVTSFRLPDGTLCREVEIAGPAAAATAVACRAGDGWRVHLALSGGSGAAGEEGAFRPASGLGAIDAYLAEAGAGPPLSPEEEASALAAR